MFDDDRFPTPIYSSFKFFYFKLDFLSLSTQLMENTDHVNEIRVQICYNYKRRNISGSSKVIKVVVYWQNLLEF